MTADHSLISFCYFHAADDNIKVDSSRSTYEHITVLQGDIGAAIELGTYGIGLRSNAVRGTSVSGVYVHRITQESTMDDGLGSLIGSRTCPWGITFEDLSLTHVYVADGARNTYSSAVKLGVYGNGGGGGYSNTDRWYFCSNSWWLDDETIQSGAGKTAATFKNVTIDLHGPLEPTHKSWVYNFHASAKSSFDKLRIGAAKVDGLTDLSGVREL